MTVDTLSMPAPMPAPMAALQTISIEELIARRQKIKEVMDKVMEEDVHYGKIPGTPKPTLYKAGAEVLCTTFMLAPKYQTIEREREGKHLALTSECSLIHIPTSTFVGSGRGSCSTRESKYAYRKASRVCPACSQETIIKGKEEYGGGWLCFAKKGGCGAKFKAGDEAIEAQRTGRVDNEDVSDQENTVLKMSDKRSLTAAVLNALACSDVFTQDVEDLPPGYDDKPGAQAPRGPQGGAQRPTPGNPPQRPQPQPGRPVDPNDPRPGYAKDILDIRDHTWDKPPSAPAWKKITVYFLGQPTPDTIYGDGILATADPEKLGGLARFMAALKAGDDGANADLDDIIQGRDPKARGAQS